VNGSRLRISSQALHFNTGVKRAQCAGGRIYCGETQPTLAANLTEIAAHIERVSHEQQGEDGRGAVALIAGTPILARHLGGPEVGWFPDHGHDPLDRR